MLSQFVTVSMEASFLVTATKIVCDYDKNICSGNTEERPTEITELVKMQLPELRPISFLTGSFEMSQAHAELITAHAITRQSHGNHSTMHAG